MRANEKITSYKPWANLLYKRHKNMCKSERKLGDRKGEWTIAGLKVALQLMTQKHHNSSQITLNAAL